MFITKICGKKLSDLLLWYLIFYLFFLKILTELEHSGVGRSKEQAARVLGHLASNASRLIRPYAEPILKVNLFGS